VRKLNEQTAEASVAELTIAQLKAITENPTWVEGVNAQATVANLLSAAEAAKASSAGQKLPPVFSNIIGSMTDTPLDLNGLNAIVEQILKINTEAVIAPGMAPEAAAKNQQVVKDMLANVNSARLFGEKASTLKEGFTLIIDKDAIPQNQLDIAGRLNELKEIQDKLGCEVKLVDKDSLPSGYTLGNAIVIARTDHAEAFQATGARVVAIGQIEEKQYMPLVPLAVFAKAMLALNA
jgi:hypothetical protein